ncbi:porphobilinogen deaminase, putative [Plasmodium malariae]|uniref:hydroxymethylbilane synthase n=1 Tax=Plasmodium malariae TaxID=5858 RepID=A0A1C3KEL0_PLAMA|nr:porphobilinogen deaminase, putative [Plasmodium malariae]
MVIVFVPSFVKNMHPHTYMCIHNNDNDHDKIEGPEQQKRSSVYKNEQKNSSCTVATSSLRRRSQIKNIYKNVKLENIRGNINTRITKLFNGQYDSIVIALCGLERLLTKEKIQDIIKNKKSSIPSKQHIISYNNTDIDLSLFSIQKISTKIIYPALCQGIIAVTSNDENSEITHILKSINDKKSEIMANIERAFLYQTEGNCMMPIGGFTKIVKNKIFFNAIINDIHGLIFSVFPLNIFFFTPYIIFNSQKVVLFYFIFTFKTSKKVLSFMCNFE